MKRSEKIEYAQRFLQERIEKDFPYPFQVSGEENFFLFRLKNGRRECCARLRQSQEMLDVLCEGTKAEREVQVERLFDLFARRHPGAGQHRSVGGKRL